MEFIKCFACDGTGREQLNYIDVAGELVEYERACLHCDGVKRVMAEYKPCSRCGEIHLLEVLDEEPLCDNCLDIVIEESLEGAK